MEYNKATLLEMLHSREVSVKFRKTDGDIRTLRGTLKQELMGVNVKTKSESTRPLNPGIVTAWDLDASAWRSFRIDNVLEVN
jgi:hypothetical protein